MSKIYNSKTKTFISNPEDWKTLLTNPDKQWKCCCSAKMLATCWMQNGGNDFPKDIKSILGENYEMLIAIPEYNVKLKSKGRSSSNDLFVLAKDNDGLVVIMIEGKVKEPFDCPIKKWNKGGNGRVERFKFLANKLGIDTDIKKYDDIYYQLFHRTASAIITAENFYAKKAIMLIHSFCENDTGFSEYKKFAEILNVPNPEINKIYHCKNLSSIELEIGWIKNK